MKAEIQRKRYERNPARKAISACRAGFFATGYHRGTRISAANSFLIAHLLQRLLGAEAFVGDGEVVPKLSMVARFGEGEGAFKHYETEDFKAFCAYCTEPPGR